MCADRALCDPEGDKKGAPADCFCLLGLDMHEIKDALILCSLLNQPADHIGRIKAMWQHPLLPSINT